ncbi:MAG: winged helix-turn-helix transcriptional regulator [SAR202 cluster bacterium]|nr:winged helix-turn-helix transcriptional regulator [SAR202 cluster bacterium]
MIELALKAISDPRRMEILRLLRDEEMAAGDISSNFPDVTRPAISQHLQVLAEARLVTVRREGTKRIYRTRPEGMQEIRAYLESYWSDNLQLLKLEAEADEGRLRKRAKTGE